MRWARPPPLNSPPLVAPRTDARLAVRDALSQAQGFDALDPSTRTALAGSLARIGSTALDYGDAAVQPGHAPFARAQNAGDEFSGVAVDKVAGTTQNIMNAVSFPRFVNELITGVFKAMNDSNQQQLTAFVDLIRNVAQTTDGFADANVGVSGARSWLAEQFPGSYVIEGGDEIDMASELDGLEPAEARERRAELQAEQDAATRLGLRPGGQPPTEAALRSALGAAEGVPLPVSNPEALVPLARQVLARNRQQLLATMIQMGLQRIVIESGRVNAAMKLHVDASSAAANDRGSQFDMRNTTEVGVGAKFGPWGAEAKMQNTIGYVSTDRTSTSENINASVDLDSGVELYFKTDYVPLNRLAGVGDVERIRVNTLNPEAEATRLSAEANARTAAAAARSSERRRDLDAALHTPPPLGAPTIDTGAIRRDAVAPGASPPAARTPPVAAPPAAPPAAPSAAPVVAAPVAPVSPATVAPAAAPAARPATPATPVAPTAPVAAPAPAVPAPAPAARSAAPAAAPPAVTSNPGAVPAATPPSCSRRGGTCGKSDPRCYPCRHTRPAGNRRGHRQRDRQPGRRHFGWPDRCRNRQRDRSADLAPAARRTNRDRCRFPLVPLAGSSARRATAG